MMAGNGDLFAGAECAYAADYLRQGTRRPPPDVQGGCGSATNAERFAAFHRDNPHVFAEIRRLALDAVACGVRRWGMRALLEIVRFNSAIRTGGDAFKINNNHAPYYARLLMRSEPLLSAFFETRSKCCGKD